MNSFATGRAVWATAATAAWVTFFVSSSAAWAAEAHPVPVSAVVPQGVACPTSPAPAAVPTFHQGDVVNICFGEPLPDSTGTSAITLGQMPAMVGDATPNSVLVVLPDESKAGEYSLDGTVNGTTFSSYLVRYYPVPKPTLTDISPKIGRASCRERV